MIYQYDINSAYASYYKYLPCLQHGEWERISELPASGNPITNVYFAEIYFHHRVPAQWYTLPVRSDKGTLLFPREGNGWYWCHEIEEARKYADITVRGGWIYRKRCDCRHFDWVYALYDERDRVGKNSGRGKVLKIVLATIYGKLAQSKGHPVFANPIWSGLVVSYCRAKLINAALQVAGGSDVLMLATDGLFCTSPRPDLIVGKGLGEWELTVHEDIFIIQSGLYLISGQKPKTRGVPQSRIVQMEGVFRERWDTFLGKDPTTSLSPFVIVPLRVFVSARLAWARNRPWTAGKWHECKCDPNQPRLKCPAHKMVKFDWKTKRTSPVIASTALLTEPVAGNKYLVSKPPDWMIGGPLDLDRLMLEGQPDWGDTLEEM